MKQLVKLWVLGITIFALGQSCQIPSEYDKMVATELAKGIRQDSLFLGIHLGMTSKDFFTHCWELNKQQIIKQGIGNTSVEYDVSRLLRHEGKVNFYPTFYEDKIVEMPVHYKYDAFAWTDDYSLDTLLVDVLKIMETTYGPLTKFDHPEKGSVYVRVDGNRRIRVFKNILQDKVSVFFTDLTVEPEKYNLQLTNNQQKNEGHTGNN